MNEIRNAAFGFAALALVCSASVSAQQRMYKCVDDKGKVYYTQTPPKECLGRETQELSRQGQVLKKSEAALTPEQRAAREAERKKKIEQEQLAREERRKNEALLNTYSSEKDIEDARARALKQAEEAIKGIEAKIAEGEKRRKKYEAEKEFYAKKPLPAKLQEDIKNNEIELKNQTELLVAKKKESSTINAKYDEDKRRFLNLTKGKPASPAPPVAKK
ncbi:MAG: DUF4124 domain-containing protein [Betaproteobacteria bacterium]|nr:DUF4124 domain-containing protein [Betaproteobacteria bacterium]MBI2959522.1 DUF4124 domain-containing protein [Betaproteobacteria bacterium]